MTLITSKRPAAGIASGLIFGALGMLLAGIDAEHAGSSVLAAILFKALGSFLILVAAASVLNALYAFVRSFRMRR